MGWSHSKLGTYTTCKLKYKLSYLEKWTLTPKYENKYAARGLAMHESFEIFGSEINTLEELEETLKKKMEEHQVSEDMSVVPTGKKFISFYDKFIKPLKEKNYTEHHEYKVTGSLKIDDNHNGDFLGYIDLLFENENEQIIMDYKSGTNIKAESYKPQLILYSYLLGQSKGWTEKQIAENTKIAIIGPLDKNAKDDDLDTFVFWLDITEKDIKNELKELREKIIEVETTEWDQVTPVDGTPGFHCQFCPFRGIPLKEFPDGEVYLGCRASINMKMMPAPNSYICHSR